MKYIPLFGEEAKGRSHIGKHWSKQYIRNTQIILNVTKGIVASGDKFFERAFGRNVEEYLSILHMPNQYVMYRDAYEKSGLINLWQDQFKKISNDDKTKVIKIIQTEDYKNIKLSDFNGEISQLLAHYVNVQNDTVFKQNDSYQIIRDKYQNLINEDIFLDMTLTYDYDNSHLGDLGKEILFNIDN